MLTVVSIVGLCLLLLGIADTRARSMALLLALVWLETILAGWLVQNVDLALMMRVPIDISAGLLAICIVTRERWSLMVPALFAVMLLWHGAFWLSWRNGVDLWYVYPHAINALWVVQVAAVAWPSGEDLVGIAGSWFSRVFARGRGIAIHVFAPDREAESVVPDRQTDVGSGSDLLLSRETRV